MIQRYVALRSVALFAISFAGASALAGPVVSEGVHLYITPRAQTYFRENLNAVLLGNGLDLSRNVWREIKFPVASATKETGDLGELRAELSPYFYGFPVNPPKLEVTLADSELKVAFKALGAEIDPAGPAAYGFPRSKGVIVLMRTQADGLQFGMKSLRVDDLANKGLLGTLGVDAFSARMTNGDRTTVKAELPILVEADGKQASLKILAVRTNLQKAAFASGFDQVRMPSLKVVIDGKEYPFDAAAFEKELRDRLPELTATIVTRLRSFFEQGAGKELIQEPFDKLAANLNIDISYPFPKKSDPRDSESPESSPLAKTLTVSLRPRTPEFTRAKLAGLSFDAEVNDVKLPKGPRTAAARGAAGATKLEGIDPTTYDVAAVLDPAAVNVVLDRAWANGILRDISMGKDDSGHPTKIKIEKPPVVTFTALPAAGQVGVHAAIGYVVRGIGGILFKGPIPIELDLVLRLAVNAKNEAEVFLDHIDESTLKVDTHATWLWPLRAKVNALVRKKIKALNETASRKPEPLVSAPIPETLVGVPLRIGSIRMDAGNLVLLATIVPKAEKP